MADFVADNLVQNEDVLGERAVKCPSAECVAVRPDISPSSNCGNHMIAGQHKCITRNFHSSQIISSALCIALSRGINFNRVERLHHHHVRANKL